MLYSIQSEWLKKKGTAAAWLTIGGAALIPVILLAARLIKQDGIIQAYMDSQFWEATYVRVWQFNAIMLLPLGLILASSLQAQTEVRNNSWKQLLATPQPYAASFFAKLLVMLMMLLQYFVLINVCIYLYAIIPTLLPNVSYPVAAIPFKKFLLYNAKVFIGCLPIISLQYLLSLQLRNFLAPLGIGIGLYVASVIGLNWKYGHLIPYNYAFYIFQRNEVNSATGLHVITLATLYTLLFLISGFVLYLSKKEKG